MAKAAVATSDQGYGCDIAIDESTGNVYVARLDRVSGGNIDVLLKMSTDTMATWGSSSAVNTTTEDLKALSLNMMSSARIFATWYNGGSRDVLGKTAADLP